MLWLLADGDRLLFVVPVLVLTLGDAVAALVGVRYGQIRFDGRADGQEPGGLGGALRRHVPERAPAARAGRARAAPLDGILIAATMA